MISYTLESNNTSGNGEVASSIAIRKSINNSPRILGKGKFNDKITNGIHTYMLKLYFYETGEDQSVNMRKIFKAHINTEEWIDVCAGGECLGDKILAQDGGAATIDAKGTPDFSKIATAADSGIYASEDEYGTSYYYRGERDLLNNNLIFGGFQWKIIRINGDGSIRIIFNGTETQFNINGTMNDTGTNTQISTAAWNTTNRDDAKYVGYMYGGANGTASTQRNGTVSAAATYNQTNTNIKTTVDNWYATNISGKPFETNVVDNLFCNDRSRTSGNGYGTSSTTYTAYTRLYSGTRTPTLICSDTNDRFTVSDEIGNKALTYPVGTISADEASMAGMVRGTNNTTGYLYTNVTYWTMSPYNYASSTANLFMINTSGQLASNGVTTSAGFRPVINLSTETLVEGSGSTSDPYIVKIPL